jgi:hypothetical protein
MTKYPKNVREHHLNFTKNQWQSQEPTRAIRHNQWLKPPLQDEAHDYIHRFVGFVALPTHYMAEQILSKFEPEPGNYLKSIDNYLFAIDDTRRSYGISTMERQLGDLMIKGIDLQRGWIKEGLYTPR